MPFVWNKQVSNYEVDVFESSSLDYAHSIRLELEDGDSVAVQFPGSAPADFVDIGTSFHTVKLDRYKFDPVYHLLQTESPIYFTAYETGGIRYAGFSTSEEAVGEGLVDEDA